MTERKYALTKIAPGFYVCPSNDGARLWAFRRYYEDGTLEAWTVQGTRKIVGHFWSTSWAPMPSHAMTLDDFDTIVWRETEGLMRSRREAIRSMERQQEPRGAVNP